nr:PREDICTED: LOW QUALITY PROTEIN: uncharacterized protein LOC105671126 [Linepithema humile]
MPKIGDVCDARCHLIHNERIKKENALRMKWFLINQQRLVGHLKEPKLVKRAKEVIEEKREKTRIDKPIIQQKPLPLWRPPRSDGSIDINIMKPVDPDVRIMLYEKKIPTFIATDNYLTERYKILPEKRFYFPNCTNWIYGWRLGDYSPPPPSEVGMKSVMLAQFYQRKVYNLQRDPEWYFGCQTKNARNFNELLTY